MDKEEVASYLGVSVRAVERYAQAGKLHVVYEKKPGGGQKAVYDPQQVEKLKEENSQPKLIERKPKENKSDALTTISSVELASSRQLLENIEKIANSLAKANEQSSESLADLTIKLVLSINEASLLSGISIGAIRKAIKNGELKKIKLGKAVQVKREDLEAWVKGL